jgi:hypothetical protein
MHHPVANADSNYHICRSMITRRQSLKRLLGIAAATITAPMINRGWFQLFAEDTTKYSARAIDLVQRGTVVDMLNPFTLLGVLAPFRETSARPGSRIPRHLLPPIFNASKIPESTSCTSE